MPQGQAATGLYEAGIALRDSHGDAGGHERPPSTRSDSDVRARPEVGPCVASVGIVGQREICIELANFYRDNVLADHIEHATSAAPGYLRPARSESQGLPWLRGWGPTTYQGTGAAPGAPGLVWLITVRPLLTCLIVTVLALFWPPEGPVRARAPRRHIESARAGMDGPGDDGPRPKARRHRRDSHADN